MLRSRRTGTVRIALLAALLGACAHSPPPDPEGSAVIAVRGTELVYDGPLTKENNARLFAAAAAVAVPPRALVITSTGGDVEAGMELGTWVFERKLDVHVPEYCISSCASYVFTAGKRKNVGPTALLIWHGGTTQEGLGGGSPCEHLETPDIPCDEQALGKLLADTLARVRKLEVDFFARIGVDQDITVLGQRPGYDCRQGYEYVGWYYSIDDMEKLGVTDVSVVGGDWQPTAPFPDVKFCRVVLQGPALRATAGVSAPERPEKSCRGLR